MMNEQWEDEKLGKYENTKNKGVNLGKENLGWILEYEIIEIRRLCKANKGLLCLSNERKRKLGLGMQYENEKMRKKKKEWAKKR